LFLTSTVRCGATSIHIHEYAFNKYGISEVTNMERAQLSEIARRLVDYFNSKVETPQMNVVNQYGEEFELFHDYELIHLRDVKSLFQLDHRVQEASLGYVVIYSVLFLLWRKGRWQNLAKEVGWGCALTLALMAALGIASIFGFEQLFVQFHIVAFSNPYWMLNPSRDYLIMLFPEDFWRDIAFLGGGAIVVEALFLGGIAWAAPLAHRRRKR
jgi:integral membrane protein (TIGR01906 family)